MNDTTITISELEACNLMAKHDGIKTEIYFCMDANRFVFLPKEGGLPDFPRAIPLPVYPHFDKDTPFKDGYPTPADLIADWLYNINFCQWDEVWMLADENDPDQPHPVWGISQLQLTVTDPIN